MNVWKLFTVGLVVTFAFGGRCDAQPTGGESPRVEFWGAVSGAIVPASGTAVTSYSPPLLLDGTYSSYAEQTLIVDRRFGLGVSGGLNLFPTPHFGLQLLVDRASCDVAGTNGPYEFTMQYVSQLPPNNQQQVVKVGQTVPWPESSGSVSQLTLGLNAAVRIGRADRINAVVSAGPSYFRITGHVEPLGYTLFNLGGHSVLFENDFRLRAALQPADGVGFNGGLEIHLPIGRHAAVVGGVRYLYSRDLHTTAEATEILNPDQITFSQSIGEIAAQLGSVPVTMSARGMRVSVGLRVP